jgi:predicted esterase
MLHGFTMNGAGLRHMCAPLEPRLADQVDFIYPDAPHAASDVSVAGLASLMGGVRPKPPNLQWWNASDDGFTYHGWSTTRDALANEVSRHAEVALLGFSQGAAVAAALAAASSRGQFPKLRFVVLIAGFTPRAHDIAPLFAEPVSVPSVHVWGEADRFAAHSPELAERFDVGTRHVLTWPGRHVVPSAGSVSDDLIELIRGQTGRISGG